LTLPIQDWAEYVAVGERYHISAIFGRLIIKKWWLVLAVPHLAREWPRSHLTALWLYTIVCGDVRLIVHAAVKLFYDNGHISSLDSTTTPYSALDFCSAREFTQEASSRKD
jgi:hypothetical protein